MFVFKKYSLFILSFSFFLLACNTAKEKQESEEKEEAVLLVQKDWAIVVHGGAGTMKRENMSEEKEAELHAKLKEVLQKGEEILANGGSSLDAVESCIQMMEESPLFNAGKGSVFTHAGTNEMDASIMDGSNLDAGAVAGVSVIKSPISAARLVMEESPHLLLSREGAEEFAREKGEEIVDPSYFFTQDRFDVLKKVQEREAAKEKEYPDEKYGTVGVVCLDQKGNLAAGTSTGGMTNKRWGRIGDSPIIGAGTYANNASCGISATGHGEFFIRAAVAHEISSLMLYKGMSVEEAAEEVVMKKLVEMGGAGGVIAMDRYGNHSMPFNTSGMYRGFSNSDGENGTFIFK